MLRLRFIELCFSCFACAATVALSVLIALLRVEGGRCGGVVPKHARGYHAAGIQSQVCETFFVADLSFNVMLLCRFHSPTKEVAAKVRSALLDSGEGRAGHHDEDDDGCEPLDHHHSHDNEADSLDLNATYDASDKQ